ncbi:MAG TPA: VCBS repeat-containing protein [Terriglobales bacterium]|nr:VCBS repeat-containing protein [Terriglobales bacterium]
MSYFTRVFSCLVLTASLSTLSNAAGFVSARMFSVAGLSLAGVTADFNHDGHLDIATADSLGFVSVLLGKGDGTFGPAAEYAVGTSPVAIAAGDINGDGIPDLVTASEFVGEAVLLNKGDGTFTVTQLGRIGTQPDGVALGDVNADGKTDLLIADYGVAGCDPGSVLLLLGNGDGTFQNSKSFSVGAVNPQAIAAADLNRDGKLDVVTGNDVTLGPVFGNSVLLGNGDGTFQTFKSANSGGSSATATVADINGDGILDLVDGGFIVVSTLLGNGDGTFQSAKNYAVPGGFSPRVADVDNDGIPDLITGGNGVGVLRGRGDGTFQNAIVWGIGSEMVVAADFNEDGKFDLAAAARKSVNVALGNGHGAFRAAHEYALSSLPTGITTGDFNNDGKADMAIIKTNIGGSLAVLLGNGNGTFKAPLTGSFGLFEAVLSADFNGDSKLDLAMSGGGTVQILLGKGDGTFTTGQRSSIPGDARSEVSGDFNHDGKLDLAVATEGPTIAVLLGNGDGTFQKAATYMGANESQSIVASDFNRDGNLDLAVVNPFHNSLNVFLGNGDGTFQSPSTVPITAPVHMEAADLNNDGKSDLFVTGASGSLLLGNGDGTFQAPVQVINADGPVRAIDVNRDGKLDLVISDEVATLLTLLVGKGDSTFKAPSFFYAGLINGFFASADFNGDNYPDLGVIDTISDAFVLLNTARP